MEADAEGFEYPKVDNTRCISCNLCHKSCPTEFPVTMSIPETLLGDTAVAVNPNDERYKDIVGKTT